MRVVVPRLREPHTLQYWPVSIVDRYAFTDNICIEFHVKHRQTCVDILHFKQKGQLSIVIIMLVRAGGTVVRGLALYRVASLNSNIDTL